MNTHIFRTAALAVAVIAFAIYPQNETQSRWYIPTHLRLQHAGNIGMISAGPSWGSAEGGVELGLSIGYVPARLGAGSIHCAALKCLFTPSWTIHLGKMLAFKPFSIGAVVCRIFGSKFDRYQDPRNYPLDYYWWNVAQRYGVLYEAELRASIPGRHLRGLGIYFEQSLWDLDILCLFSDSRRSFLHCLMEKSVMGVGLKAYL